MLDVGKKGRFSSLYIFKLYYLSFYIALTRASSTMQNRNAESKYFCPILYLKGKAFDISLLNITLGVDFYTYLVCEIFLFNLN